MKIITKQSSFVVLAITLLALILTSCKSDKTDCGAVTKHTNIPEGYYVETIPYSVFKGILMSGYNTKTLYQEELQFQ